MNTHAKTNLLGQLLNKDRPKLSNYSSATVIATEVSLMPLVSAGEIVPSTPMETAFATTRKWPDARMLRRATTSRRPRWTMARVRCLFQGMIAMGTPSILQMARQVARIRMRRITTRWRRSTMAPARCQKEPISVRQTSTGMDLRLQGTCSSCLGCSDRLAPMRAAPIQITWSTMLRPPVTMGPARP